MTVKRFLGIVARISAWTLTIAAGLVMLGAVAFVAVPRLLNWQGIIVLSGSMEPTLRTGGLVFIDRDIDPEQLEVGDVITFRGNGQTQVTHRIISVMEQPEGRRYETKGDANGTADQTLVAPHAIAGKMVVAVPYAGHWANWLQRQNNFQLLIWPIVGLIVISELWSIAGQLRTNKQPEATVVDSLPAASVRPVRVNLLDRLASPNQETRRSDNS